MSSSTPTSRPHPPDRYLLVSGDFERTGGMDMANYFLADFIARQGAPVHIVSHNVDPALAAFPNVTWTRAPRPRHSTLIGEPILRALGQRAARRSGGEGTGIVVNGGNCALPGVNWVHYVHAATKPQPARNWLRRMKARFAHRMFLRQEEAALHRARLIITNSQRTRNDILQHYGLDPSLVRTVYYGTEPADFYPPTPEEKTALRLELNLPPDAFLIVFVGAMGDRRKGFDTLFEAWKKVAPETRSAAKILVIGRGAELPHWQKLAEEQAPGSFLFLGFRRDVPRILRACDAGVAPTRYEAYGLAVHEALCCGLPTIVSRDAGVAERCPACLNDLLLRDPEDVVELTGKLDLLVRRRAEWPGLMRPEADALRVYTWEMMARRIYELLQET